ncbi:MAG: SDR family oxidoreductase [Actinomycetota bacterium]|nr:SDR family oxidoreductase [Actinomycetota bacterium]
MPICEDRVVIITGAGNGIGRAHALAFAAEGAKVVVNDLGGARDGSGSSASAAQAVVDEITAAGGQAVASGEDISLWAGAQRLVSQALSEFGGLDVVVNNVGQANYGAAKAGIAALSIIAAEELGRYGVTVNMIAPTALTRMTEDLAGVIQRAEANESGFGPLAPENISPIVVWLGSTEPSAVTGRCFSVHGGRIAVNEGWANGPTVDKGELWEPEELGHVIPDLVAQAAVNAGMNGQRPPN